jgi:hypothetical protein
MRSQSFVPEPQDLFVSNDGSLADSQANLKKLIAATDRHDCGPSFVARLGIRL